METFRVEAVPGGGACTLVLHGEADLAVAADIIELGTLSLAEPDTHRLIIDLAAVTFADSSALGALVQLHNVARDCGKTVVLDHVPARVRRVLQLSRLDVLFATQSADTDAGGLDSV